MEEASDIQKIVTRVTGSMLLPILDSTQDFEENRAIVEYLRSVPLDTGLIIELINIFKGSSKTHVCLELLLRSLSHEQLHAVMDRGASMHPMHIIKAFKDEPDLIAKYTNCEDYYVREILFTEKAVIGDGTLKRYLTDEWIRLHGVPFCVETCAAALRVSNEIPLRFSCKLKIFIELILKSIELKYPTTEYLMSLNIPRDLFSDEELEIVTPNEECNIVAFMLTLFDERKVAAIFNRKQAEFFKDMDITKEINLDKLDSDSIDEYLRSFKPKRVFRRE